MSRHVGAGWGVYYQTGTNEQTAYWFSKPEAWRLKDPRLFRALMYQRARGIWELPKEVSGPFPVRTRKSVSNEFTEVERYP